MGRSDFCHHLCYVKIFPNPQFLQHQGFFAPCLGKFSYLVRYKIKWGKEMIAPSPLRFRFVNNSYKQK